MKNYRVYFKQINQQYFDVKADSKEAAVAKAEREWKKENAPCCNYVAELEGQ